MSDECDFGCLPKGTKIKVGLPKPFENIPITEWISVNDKLPKEYVRVLISCDEGICTGKLSYGRWQCDPIGSYASDGCVFDVTHWMPLPNPPKEKS